MNVQEVDLGIIETQPPEKDAPWLFYLEIRDIKNFKDVEFGDYKASPRKHVAQRRPRGTRGQQEQEKQKLTTIKDKFSCSRSAVAAVASRSRGAGCRSRKET